MSKKDFIAVFETTLLCANLDITGLSLIDDNHVMITFKGNGTLKESEVFYYEYRN